RAIVSSVLRTKDRAQTVITEARNHTLGDRISDTVNDYVEQCREEIRENREHPDRNVYIFGRKFEKGDRKSIILLILFILLMVAVVGYFVVMSLL
ncbi:MAG TPA: hypothetical protein O0X27_06470, partial [Methanocorpusculum sp.]|nr:hypothetical protein [Methanocorpusculum sp.]